MGFELQDGQGSLFRNEKTKDSQPDYTGSLLIEGTLYRVAGWIKDGRKGKFMSLKAEPKQEGQNQGRGGQNERAPVGGGDYTTDPSDIF